MIFDYDIDSLLALMDLDKALAAYKYDKLKLQFLGDLRLEVKSRIEQISQDEAVRVESERSRRVKG